MMEEPTYTEGICADGAAILKDGEMLRIETILETLNRIEALQAENAGLKEQREKADFALIDKYRDPKSGSFNFPEDVVKIIRALDTARNDALNEAAKVVRKSYEMQKQAGAKQTCKAAMQTLVRTILNALKKDSPNGE